jgi:high-affinity iron transporter
VDGRLPRDRGGRRPRLRDPRPQEAGVVPGPFTALAPVAGGTVAVGFAGFPFGWAFDVSSVIAPGGALATILQALVGFMPRMSWLQVIAWALYIAIVGTFFVRGIRVPRHAAAPASVTPPTLVPAHPHPTQGAR